MVRRVAGRRPGLEPENAFADDGDVLLRDRRELPPQAVELVAVQPACASFEPARIHEMRRTDCAYVYAQVRVAPDERPGGTCVIEVDVRDDQVPQVLERESVLAKARLERIDAGRGAAVHERGLRRLKQVRRDDLRTAEVAEVEKLQTTSAA
jgi:hypothetical protein